MGGVSDLRIAARSLRRAPIFTITSIGTLALGMALATAAFSLINGVLIRPLPFANAGQIVVLAQQNSLQNLTGVSYPNFLDWQHQAPSSAFEGMAYVRGRSTVLALPDGPHSVLTAFTSAGFFAVLRPTIALGRGFNAAEERDGGHVVVLTHALWRDRFGSDPTITGRSIATTDGMFTVVGVLPRDLVMPEWAELYVPLATVAHTEAVLAARDFHADSRTLGRLKPGVTLERARLNSQRSRHGWRLRTPPRIATGPRRASCRYVSPCWETARRTSRFLLRRWYWCSSSPGSM